MKYLIMLPLLCMLLVTDDAWGQVRWKAPDEADTLKNPYSKDDVGVIASGEKLYMMYCAICHGEKGDGGGEAGQTWNPPPADFTSKEVQQQSDGQLFWKAMEGNPPNMLPYKKMLSKEEVWQLITYLRQFARE